MIRLFIMYPAWYFVPALITMSLLVAGARLFPSAYKGELQMLKDPALILPWSLIWFLVVPFLLIGGLFLCGEKFFRFLIPQPKKDE